MESLCSLSISKIEAQKFIWWPTFQKGGMSKLQNAKAKRFHASTQIWTVDHLAPLEPKRPLFWNFGTEYPYLRQISHQNFRNKPFISPLPFSDANKPTKYNLEAFQKTISFTVAKFSTFSKIITCEQKPSQRYWYVKNGHMWDVGPVEGNEIIGICTMISSIYILSCTS